MTYSGPDRREHPRVEGNFIISYRILKEADNTDISQTKNISVGGMLLTTNRGFGPGTQLALTLRLPFAPDPITLVGEVIESREVFKNLIYDTRIQLVSVEGLKRKVIDDTVKHYLKPKKG